MAGEDIEQLNKISDEEALKALKKAKIAMQQKMLSFTRKAVQDYNLIETGDRVCVGVSGGKDSLALLTILAGLRRFYPKKFELKAVSIAMGFQDMSYEPIADYCKSIDVDYEVVETKIREIVFDIRKEKNPCALCANLRRGALNDNAKKFGCNVVALGHHRDDVIETAFLSLSYEGRFYCFEPKTYLERSGVTVIRPMIYIPECEIKSYARLFDFPVVHNSCPMDKASKRSDIKDTLDRLNQENPIFRDNVFGAVKRCVWKTEDSL